MSGATGAIFFYFNIFAADFPARFRSVAGSEGCLVDVIRFGAGFFNFVGGDMEIVFFQKQISIFYRTDLVFKINIQLTAGKNILTDRQNNISPGKRASDFMVVSDKICCQRFIAF